jgi:hypothetical protein
MSVSNYSAGSGEFVFNKLTVGTLDATTSEFQNLNIDGNLVANSIRSTGGAINFVSSNTTTDSSVVIESLGSGNANLKLLTSANQPDEKLWEIFNPGASGGGLTKNNLAIYSYQNSAPAAARNALEISADTSTISFCDSSVSDPVLQVRGSAGTGIVYNSLFNIPRGASLMTPDYFVPFGSGVNGGTANTNINSRAPWVWSGPVDALNSVAFFLNFGAGAPKWQTGAYLVQVVIETDATVNTVLNDAEMIELVVRDNVSGGNLYTGANFAIPVKNLAVPVTIPTQTLDFTYTGMIYINAEDPDFDIYFQLYLQTPTPPASPSTTKIPLAYIFLYPMLAQLYG